MRHGEPVFGLLMPHSFLIASLAQSIKPLGPSVAGICTLKTRKTLFWRVRILTEVWCSEHGKSELRAIYGTMMNYDELLVFQGV